MFDVGCWTFAEGQNLPHLHHRIHRDVQEIVNGNLAFVAGITDSEF